MTEATYLVKIEPCNEGGYWAYFPALPGCHTQGKTLEEVMAMAKDALTGYLEVLREYGDPIPAEKSLPKWTGIELPISAAYF